jgi:Fur family zinc uptake transcriptional regulator
MHGRTHEHNHAHCLQSAVAQAEELCAARGVRLTAIRRRVLELVWSGHRAIKAYEVLERLEAGDGAQAPITVYRALDFLQEQGLVHKIESLNGFVGCAHPVDGHNCQFFICDACGTVSEACNAAVTKQIERSAREAGFAPARHLLEIHGTCAGCQ